MNGTLKILASAFIIIGSGYLGLIIASRYTVRVRQIEQFRLAIEQMGFSIGFLKMPLSEALLGVSKSRKGAVGRILQAASEEVSMDGVSPSAAFERSVLRNRDALCMDEEELSILSEFAASLGKGGVDSELSNINAACARLKIAQTAAESLGEQQGRMWRGLGFLFGIFVVIILF